MFPLSASGISAIGISASGLAEILLAESGPPGRFCRQILFSFFRKLTSLGYHVLSFDYRGFGDSSNIHLRLVCHKKGLMIQVCPQSRGGVKERKVNIIIRDLISFISYIVKYEGD